MAERQAPGHIIVLNGTLRSRKSSFIAVIQDTFDGFMSLSTSGTNGAYATPRGILPDCAPGA